MKLCESVGERERVGDLSIEPCLPCPAQTYTHTHTHTPIHIHNTSKTPDTPTLLNGRYLGFSAVKAPRIVHSVKGGKAK
jgi:hypothetical protein